MKVSNMLSSRGNKIANQFVISTSTGEVFQSYNSIIAERKNGRVTLDAQYWDYSATTLKYLKIFLMTTASKKVIQERIDSGIYETEDLN